MSHPALLFSSAFVSAITGTSYNSFICESLRVGSAWVVAPVCYENENESKDKNNRNNSKCSKAINFRTISVGDGSVFRFEKFHVQLV